jgi:hypothetical protein
MTLERFAFIVVLAAGAALSGSSVRSAEPDAPRRHAERKEPVYARDPRVKQEVERAEASARVAMLLGLLEQVSKDKGVTLLAQPGIEDKKVRIVAGKQKIEDVMAQFAATFTAEWYVVRGRYVLARSRALAELGAATDEDVQAELKPAVMGLAKSITPEQWARMDARQGLRYADLTPQQQAFADRYAGAIRLSAVTLQAATLPRGRDIVLQVITIASTGERELAWTCEARMEILGRSISRSKRWGGADEDALCALPRAGDPARIC